MTKKKQKTAKYQDVPERMRDACFAMLVDFVEKEKPFPMFMVKYNKPVTRKEIIESGGWSKKNAPPTCIGDCGREVKDKSGTVTRVIYCGYYGLKLQMEEARKAGAETWFLYRWWTVTRKKMMAREASLYKRGARIDKGKPRFKPADAKGLSEMLAPSKFTSRSFTLEFERERLEQVMLKRLIKIREHLWT